MSDAWKHQLRLYFDSDDAEIAREHPDSERLAPLNDILTKHRATLSNQLQAFEDYVAEAEKTGVESFPLYKWTKMTIEDPEKRAKHLKAFAIQLSGEILYDKAAADALEADLAPLVGKGLVTRLSRHDTNPANNIRPPDDLV